jgi:CRP-like cAMP-binding protein
MLRVLATGELLGELGLFGNAPRSATAVAATAVTLNRSMNRQVEPSEEV